MKINLKNKTILITAGSKGIGFELAQQLLKLNAKICICSRNSTNLNLAKKKLYKYFVDGKLLILKHDIAKINNNLNLIKKIKKKFNTGIDILINNSGGPKPSKIEKLTNKDWQNAINSNLLGSISITKEVIDNMKKKRWGRIINLTSTTAKEPALGMALSNVTRSALASYSKTLSLELAANGITVNTILTGGCLTDRFKNLIQINSKNKKDFNIKIKKVVEQTAMKKIAKPIEFVQLIIFLCSEYSSYINGTAIEIDGGNSKSIF